MADDELWVANANASNWVEEGMALGDPWDESVPTNIRYWFWADNRPFYGYFEHDFTGLSVNLNRDYDALIQYRGEGAWDVFRDGSPIGLSIPNFLAPAEWLAAGSESTVTTPHVDAYVKFLRWRDTGGGWHGDWVNGANNASLQEQDTYAIDWLTTYQGAHVTSSTGGCP